MSLRPRAVRWVAVVAVALGIGLVIRPHAQQAAAGGPAADFRTGITLVRTDVIVRDANGAFIADLEPDDFIVEEDGVPQDVVSLVLVNGGRVYNQLILPGAPAREGIILPTTQGVGQEAAGRVIILFVDELHFRASHTLEVRRLIKTIGDVLIHEGDLFGVVGNGTSGVAVDLTYDRTRLTAAANEVLGVGLSPRELVYDVQVGLRGPEEIRWRSHQAFKTVYDLLVNLEAVRDRRKVLVYISNGYDLNPLALERMARAYGMRGPDGARGFSQGALRADIAGLDSPIARVQAQGAVFADGELVNELAELTRAANRANTTFYTVDPRGLMAAPEFDFNVQPEEWAEYQRTTRNSLRTLADLTGGLSIVNTNNFDGLLKRIDAESSDYYVLGFYASNPDPTDPTARTRQLRLTVNRAGATVQARTSYEFGNIVGAVDKP